MIFIYLGLEEQLLNKETQTIRKRFGKIRYLYAINNKDQQFEGR